MSCPDCFKGSVMDKYEPKGTIETLHTLPTYIARPSAQPKGIIIIIPDAFGMQFPNNKHLADVYASHGFLTYLPDFMNGTAAPSWMVYTVAEVMATPKGLWGYLTKPYYLAWTLSSFIPFILRNRYGNSMPIVKPFFEAVRNANPSLPIGAAGFCWGGQHTICLASGMKTPAGKLYSDAHFTAHPSNVSFPDDIKNVTLPLSIAVAGKDFVFTPALGEKSEAILKEKEGKGGPKDWEIKYYEGAGHGFGIRADPGNEEVVKQADASIKQAVDFYDKVFSAWKPS